MRSVFAIDAPLGVPARWTRPGEWVGVAQETVEWGVLAARAVLAIAGAIVMATAQDTPDLRLLGVATGAVVLGYTPALALLLRAGRLREAVLAGLALDTIVVGGAMVAAYGLVAAESPATHELQHDLLRPAIALVALAVLRLRPMAGAVYALSLPWLLLGLGLLVAGEAVEGADYLAHAGGSMAFGVALLLVAVTFHITWHRLEESAAERSRLVSTAAHELRGPLTATKAYIDLMRDGSVGPLSARQEDVLARASRATGRMEDMLSMFSQLEQAESPQFPLRLETVTLAGLARDVREGVAPAAAERKLQITIEDLDSLPPVRVDRGSAEQVLTNLLSNAIKHSPRNGRIRLSACGEDGYGGLTVEDEGPGVAAEDVPHVFERFYRGAQTKRMRLPGTGLGLYVSRSLLDRQGGRIWVESVPNGGAAFSFLLPASTAASRPEPGRVAGQG